MKILIVSDLHLEFGWDWNVPAETGDFDVSIFAGDIMVGPRCGIELLKKMDRIQDRPCIYVPGNHEFYGLSIDEEIDRMRYYDTGNITFLDRKTKIINGVRFIGVTFWTNYGLDGNVEKSRLIADMGISDHRVISKIENGENRRFTSMDALKRHDDDLDYLVNELSKDFDGPTVVVTHHGCHHLSIHPRFHNNPLNGAFVSEYENLIKIFKPTLWVHGHVHNSFDYFVGETHVVVNPRGYGDIGDIENPDFNPSKIVEV